MNARTHERETSALLSHLGLPNIAVDLVMELKTDLEIKDIKEELQQLRGYFFPKKDPSRCLPLLKEFPLRKFNIDRLRTDCRFISWIRDWWFVDRRGEAIEIVHYYLTVRTEAWLDYSEEDSRTRGIFSDKEDIDRCVHEACVVLMSQFGIKTKEEAEVIFWTLVKKRFLEDYSNDMYFRNDDDTDISAKEALDQIYSEYKAVFNRESFPLYYYNC